MMRGSAVPTTVWSSASNKRVSIKAPSTLKRANPRRRRPLSGPACFCDTDDVSIAFSSIDFFLLCGAIALHDRMQRAVLRAPEHVFPAALDDALTAYFSSFGTYSLILRKLSAYC